MDMAWSPLFRFVTSCKYHFFNPDFMTIHDPQSTDEGRIRGPGVREMSLLLHTPKYAWLLLTKVLYSVDELSVFGQ